MNRPNGAGDAYQVGFSGVNVTAYNTKPQSPRQQQLKDATAYNPPKEQPEFKVRTQIHKSQKSMDL
jgi:hypothetical protein